MVFWEAHVVLQQPIWLFLVFQVRGASWGGQGRPQGAKAAQGPPKPMQNPSKFYEDSPGDPHGMNTVMLARLKQMRNSRMPQRPSTDPHESLESCIPFGAPVPFAPLLPLSR